MDVELKIQYSESEIEQVLRGLGYQIEIHRLADNPDADITSFSEYRLALRGDACICVENEQSIVFKRVLEEKVREITTKICSDCLYE